MGDDDHGGRRAALVAAAVVVGLVAAAVGGVAVVNRVTASGDFYDPPTVLVPRAAGTIIRSERVTGTPFDDRGTVWRVLYHSRSIHDDDIAVSGFVVVPKAPAPPGGRDIVTFGHPTAGVADSCAPSHDPGRAAVPVIDELVHRGLIVAATDFEGLGTPGRHPYLVGDSEARGMLDAARAAQRLDQADASDRVVAWGYSQGGHGALFTGEIAHDYAPELDLRGVVAHAPATDVQGLVTFSSFAPNDPLTPLVVAGYAAAYDDLEPSQVVSPAGLDKLHLVDEECTFGTAFGGIEGGFLKTPLQDDARWNRRMDENRPGRERIDVPVLIYQGRNDGIVDPGATLRLANRLCGDGTTVSAHFLKGATHATIIERSALDTVAWIGDRFAGRAADSTC